MRQDSGARDSHFPKKGRVPGTKGNRFCTVGHGVTMAWDEALLKQAEKGRRMAVVFLLDSNNLRRG